MAGEYELRLIWWLLHMLFLSTMCISPRFSTQIGYISRSLLKVRCHVLMIIENNHFWFSGIILVGLCIRNYFDRIFSWWLSRKYILLSFSSVRNNIAYLVISIFSCDLCIQISIPWEISWSMLSGLEIALSFSQIAFNAQFKCHKKSLQPGLVQNYRGLWVRL